MALLENHLGEIIKKFLGEKRQKTIVGCHTKISEILLLALQKNAEIEGNIEHLLGGIGLESSFSLVREEVMKAMIDTTGRVRKILDELEKEEKERRASEEEVDKYLRDFENEMKEGRDEIVDEVFEILQETKDFEVRIGGEKVVYSIRKIPDLRKKVEKLCNEVLENHYEVLQKEIEELRKNSKERRGEEEKKKEEMKNSMNEVLTPFIEGLVKRIGDLNIPHDNKFQEFVDVVQLITKMKIEIQVVVPDFEDDVLYVNFLHASEQNDADLLRSIGLEVFPDIDWYSWNVGDMKNFLATNYFR
jgi:hypothetical protein